LIELLAEEKWQCLEADNELKEVAERGNEEEEEIEQPHRVNHLENHHQKSFILVT
jgi:hypothetical protein